MAHSSLQSHMSFFILLLQVLFLSHAQPSFRPKALVLKVTKDPSTSQYLTTIPQGTPKFPARLTLDLGGDFTWLDCESTFNSSTRRPIPCRSAQCSLAGSTFCSSDGLVCGLSASNTISSVITSGDLSSDSAELRSAGRTVEIRSLLFTCTKSFLVKGLAGDVLGIAGLGRSKVSLPSLLSAAFSFPRRFSVCLGPSSSSLSRNGFVIFGDDDEDGNEKLRVLSKTLIYTPLVLNPTNIFYTQPSPEYFVSVKSIRVGDEAVPVNASLLSFNENHHGGVKLSTVNPNTLMETSIHDSVVTAFTATMEAKKAVRVASVAPFTACYRAEDAAAAPAMELVMRGEKNGAVWRMEWPETMVRVSGGGGDVACLGIVDGGPLGFMSLDKVTQAAVVIGGRQMEDRVLRFNLAASRLGFSDSLLAVKTSCSDLNLIN